MSGFHRFHGAPSTSTRYLKMFSVLSAAHSPRYSRRQIGFSSVQPFFFLLNSARRQRLQSRGYSRSASYSEMTSLLRFHAWELQPTQSLNSFFFRSAKRRLIVPLRFVAS